MGSLKKNQDWIDQNNGSARSKLSSPILLAKIQAYLLPHAGSISNSEEWEKQWIEANLPITPNLQSLPYLIFSSSNVSQNSLCILELCYFVLASPCFISVAAAARDGEIKYTNIK